MIDFGSLLPVDPDPEQEQRERDLRQAEADRTRKVTMSEWLRDGPSWLILYLRKTLGLYSKVEWIRDTSSDDDDVMGDGREPAFRLAGAEVVCSKMERNTSGDYHLIMLDIDHETAVTPSSTSGHYHLWINHSLDRDDWEKFIKVCAEIGLIEEGYAAASLRRDGTYLRLPWIRKGYEREDARAALQEWLDDPQPEPSPDLPF